jgi:hypothetical protein
MDVSIRKTGTRIGLALVAAFSMASFSQATTVYDESALGDFNAGQLFTLSDTHNIFVGSQAWAEPDKVDGFRFTVQAGQQATIHFDQSFINLSTGEAQAWVWELKLLPAGTGACTPDSSGSPISPYSCASVSGQQSISMQTFSSEPGFGEPAIPFALPALNQVTLGAGTYLLNDNFGFARIGTGGNITGAFSYSIDIQQTAVPIPAAVWLFGSALMGLVNIKKAKRKI